MKYFIAILLTAAIGQTFAQNQLYQVKLMQAAPGKLLTLIDKAKEDLARYEAYGIGKPYLMRHSQGDKWDLLLIYPISSLENFFSTAQTNRLSESNLLRKTYEDPIFDLIAFQEEAVFAGPDVSDFGESMDQFNFYHVEIFTALAGAQESLRKEREMENVYLEALNRQPNFIFTRVYGASWDIFTIGCYQSLLDYAQSGDLPAQKENEAAVEAGFTGSHTIGSYLREFLREHHDTLAGAVRPD